MCSEADHVPDAAGLRWRCRRGMRELDVILGRWLEVEYPRAATGLQQQFARLLECEDDRLWDLLTARGDPAGPELEAIVEAIRRHAGT